MIGINFIQPDESKVLTKECQTLVGQMTKLLERLKNGHKYSTLTAENRAELVAEGYSGRLINNLVFLTQRVPAWDLDGIVEKDKIVTGFTNDAFNPNYYSYPALVEALIKSNYGRCAYCETLIQQSQYGVVDHFRPMEGYMDQSSDTLFRPGYYFLAYTLSNLFYTCEICSLAYKGDYFPVIGKRVPNIGINDEVSAFINPYTEDPRDFIRFNPMNGQAYPFDLVNQFYDQIKNMGKTTVEQNIWKDPTNIPGQYNYQGELISNSTINNEYQSWLNHSGNPRYLSRGTQTINLIGLNRTDLIRSRASHLRQLRGLNWTSTSATGSDQTAAQNLIRLLSSGEITTAVDAPQYLSLSIDALKTWENPSSETENFNWIETYNGIIEAFVPNSNILTHNPNDNTLMYLVLKNESQLKNKRRIISLSANDKIYGYPYGLTGLFLNINWTTDRESHISIKSKCKETKTTLNALLNNSPEVVLNTFRNSEVWALGSFSPITFEK